MSVRKWLGGAAVVAVAAACVSGRQDGPSGKPDPAEFQKLIDDYCAAWSTETGEIDTDKPGRFYARDADAVIYDPAPPLKGYTGWAEFAPGIKANAYDKAKRVLIVPNKDVRVKPVGAAVVTTYTAKLSTTFKDGRRLDADFRQSNVWEKRDGRWLIVHEHASTVPTEDAPPKKDGRPAGGPPKEGQAAAAFGDGFTHHYREVRKGMTLHYVAGGRGDPVVLLHGWPQTSHSWRKVAPRIAAKGYTVICPDLPGLGDSGHVPADYSKRDAAADLHALLQKLGHKSVLLAGTDWGGPTAYALAANHPATVRRVAVMECPFPGFGAEERTSIARPDFVWHFGFHMTPEVPELLTAGREREYLATFFRKAHNPAAMTPADIDEYARCYSAPGAMRSSLAYYRSIPKDRAENREAAKVKLRMPVLAVGGDKALADHVAKVLPQLADDVRGTVLKDCGHYLAEERPDELADRLLAFFGEKPR